MTVDDSKRLLDVEDLAVYFKVKQGTFGLRREDVKAVNGVSFHIDAGETLGLVGESGSGKSTIGRALLQLVEKERGVMRLNGKEIIDTGRMLDFRQRVQVIFQDPYSSLNPAMVIEDIIGEPLKLHTTLDQKARKNRIVELLDQVGMAAHHLERYPSEFSGGQRQRIAIARALALDPELIICDEAVSALDVSTQSQVINLLEEIQERQGVSYLFIAHDLAVVRHISHRIGVLYLGHFMEEGPADRLYEAPAHPYTQMLLAAVPVSDPKIQQQRKKARQLIPVAELPGPLDLPLGCPFHTRCPSVMPVCRTDMPVPTEVEGGGWAACHLQSQ